MTQYEIDQMMRDLPSQRERYARERRRFIVSEVIAALAFILCVAILALT